MVNFVDVLVQRAPVERAVRPIMPCILEDEEYRDLIGHFEEGWKRNTGLEAKVLRRRMEEPGHVSLKNTKYYRQGNDKPYLW